MRRASAHLRERLGVALALGALSGVVGACPSLESIPLEVCGNGVVEESVGEDCDAPPESPAQSSDGSRCARPSEPDACHFVWDATTCCPADAGAGLDGRCRKPSGVFGESSLLHIDEPAQGLANRDVDGDGFRDLGIRYLNREIELRFLGPDADPRPVRDVRPTEESAQATFGNLSDDVDPAPDACGRPTAFASGIVMIPGSDGVRVLVGSSEGLLPQAFPTFTTEGRSVPIALPLEVCVGDLPLDALPPQLDCPGALGDGPEGAELIGIDFSAAVADDPRLRLRAFPGLGIDDLTGPIQRVGVPDWRGCDAILLALGPEAPTDLAESALVVGLCAGGDGGEDRAEILARIPTGADARVFVVDANGDAIDDVVVGVDGALRVHLGDGAGRFGVDGEGIVEIDTSAGDGAPLAVGHLDDDAALDVVFPGGILGSVCDDDGDCRRAVFSLFGRQGRLVDAVLADVNDDGRLDVVGAMLEGDPATQPALAVVTSGDSGLYTLDTRPTESRPRELHAGDFDGDGIGDVAMVVGDPSQCDTPNALQILYGERGLPGDARTVARIDGVVALATGLIGDFTSSIDGVSDIGVTTTCVTGDGSEEHQASILFGNQSRGVDSSYLLVGTTRGDAQRLVFATGKVLPGDAHPALVALGTRSDLEDELSLWRIPSTGDAELDPGSNAPAYQPSATGIPTADSAHAFVVGDLGCVEGVDPTTCAADEIVVFQSSALPALDEPRLTIFGSSSSSTPLATTGPCPGLPGSGAYLTSAGVRDARSEGRSLDYHVASLVDVDGDGRDDVIAWWFGVDPATGAFAAGGAYVFWNEESGFSGTCPEPIATPDGLAAASVTPIDLGDETPWLAFTTHAGIYLAHPGKERDLQACADTEDAARCRAVPGLTGVGDLTVLDFDHDGLEDLVVATASGLDVYPQRPLDEVRVETASSVNEDD